MITFFIKYNYISLIHVFTTTSYFVQGKDIIFTSALSIHRLQIAALHFNENAKRDQAKNKDGALQFVLRFPKFRKGDSSVAKIRTKPTYGI